jgi:hypothetical protein
MPSPQWEHDCGHAAVLRTEPRCRACGRSGTFVGWGLSIHEAMARYQYVYGLKPVGHHRGMADAALGGMRSPCERCSGLGVLTIDEHGWSLCPQCEGTGGFWTRPEAEVDAIRRTVLESFPHAEPSRALPGFLSVTLLHDLARGEMVAGERPPETKPGASQGEADTGDGDPAKRRPPTRGDAT